MSSMRELTDAELDAVCGGGHHHHHTPFGGSAVFNQLFTSLFQQNITVQIGVALFGGSVSQTSNSTNVIVI